MAAQSPREKPGVYRTFPNQVNLRLSDEQESRVMAAAKARSKTRSDFIRDATMALVLQVEEEQRVRKREKSEKADRAFVPRNPKSPSVFGAFAFGKPAEEPLPTQEQPQQPTIVIQTPPPAPVAPAQDQIDVLTDYVLGARNIVEREDRGRTVEKIITASTPSIDDRKRIAKALDDRIALKAALKSPPSVEKKSSIWSWLK